MSASAPLNPTRIKEPPALAHIEKTLADSYRKEIDQEENIWRSLAPTASRQEPAPPRDRTTKSITPTPRAPSCSFPASRNVQ